MQGNIEDVTRQITKDLQGDKKKQDESIKRLLSPFNQFVKDALKRGDFDKYKKIQEEQNKEVKQDEYIHDLASIFLEPVLPVSLENPSKYDHLIEQLSKLYVKTYL